MKFDKDEIKNSLTIDQIEDIVADLGGEPQNRGDYLVCKTICHGGDSHKLYYYDNTKLFQCYTNDGSMDIFDLIIKVKKQDHEDLTLYNAIVYVINFFALNFEDEKFQKRTSLQDWDFLNKWEENSLTHELQKKVELEIFDDKILKNLPQPIILPWLKEGITFEVCKARGIRYDPAAQAIIIPHWNINNQLIGIRERTLVKENEQYGKYKPAVLNQKMYNHPLSFNLYNLNFSKAQIMQLKKAFVFESEKSCLKFASFFGIENDISVACCGSNLISYQVELLLSLGIQELIISLDRQYKEIKDEEWKSWTNKLYKIYNKYGKYVQISYLFDTKHLLDYKDSPIDKGKEIFLQLFKDRIIL